MILPPQGRGLNLNNELIKIARSSELVVTSLNKSQFVNDNLQIEHL